MSRIWLLRVGVIAVLAVLVGSWGLGLAGFGDTPPPTKKVTSPVAPDESTVPVIHRSIVIEKAKPRRTRDAEPSPAALTPEAVDEPVDDTPTTTAPTGPDATPHEPSEAPSGAPPPSNPPTPPADECTDLIDCVLDPRDPGRRAPSPSPAEPG